MKILFLMCRALIRCADATGLWPHEQAFLYPINMAVTKIYTASINCFSVSLTNGFSAKSGRTDFQWNQTVGRIFGVSRKTGITTERACSIRSETLFQVAFLTVPACASECHSGADCRSGISASIAARCSEPMVLISSMKKKFPLPSRLA